MGNFCTKCGKPLQESASFCGECGARIETINTPDMPISEITADLEGLYIGKPRHLLIEDGNLILKTDLRDESKDDVQIHLSKIIAIKVKKYDKKDEGVALFCETERESKIESSLEARKERNCFIYRSNKSNDMIECLASLLKENSQNFKDAFVFSVDFEKGVKEEKEALEKEERLIKSREEREREQNAVRCPMCRSTNLAANNKGFGLGKALLGGLLVGSAGLAAGCIGAGKVRLTCLKCGYQFNAGQEQ